MDLSVIVFGTLVGLFIGHINESLVQKNYHRAFKTALLKFCSDPLILLMNILYFNGHFLQSWIGIFVGLAFVLEFFAHIINFTKIGLYGINPITFSIWFNHIDSFVIAAGIIYLSGFMSSSTVAISSIIGIIFSIIILQKFKMLD